MRLGMVHTPAGEPSVAVRRGDDWVPLWTVPGADRLGSAATDLLAFLAAGEQVRQQAEPVALARGRGRAVGGPAGPAAQHGGGAGTVAAAGNRDPRPVEHREPGRRAGRPQGRKLKFTNNAAVAADGTVYFSDSWTRFRIEHYKQDLLEHRPNGRVFRYHPSAAGLELVADGLYFPNGVALAPDASFLLVAQTAGYDIVRIPLTGPQAGRPEPFVSNLPGLPDNS